MKKVVLVTLAALLIGACGFLPTPPANPTQPLIVESPTAAATDTPMALPTDTVAPTIETATPTADVFLNPTITPFSTGDLTTTPVTATLVETGIGTPAAGAGTSTSPPISSFPSSVTPSPTLGVLTYGTLPPAVPSNLIALWNKSKAEAYISLQQQEGGAILEYPVRGQIYVDIPLGEYIYVAWVGGRKMTGSFRVGAIDNIRIILFKDRVVIER